VPATLDRSGSPLRINLEGALDIACAADLKALLAEALSPGADVVISIAEDVTLDVTALQLLMAAEQACQASGPVVHLERPWPEPLRRAMAEAGFDRLPFSGGGA